jgi:hypothetical protein
MRESPPFEVRLQRFGVWRAAVAIVASFAIAAVAAWAWSTAAARAGESVAWVFALAAALAAATVAAALSLVRVPAGVLARRDGVWSFAPQSGPAVAGALTVALDWGAFFLLRIDGGRERVWLPVQRRGLERDWHSLRCALHASTRPTAAPAHTVPPAE